MAPMNVNNINCLCLVGLIPAHLVVSSPMSFQLFQNFRLLREKGFHHVLASSVCERRGEVERKRRSDAGRTLSAEEKQALRQKLKKARGPRAGGAKQKSLSPIAPKPDIPVTDEVGEALDVDQPNVQEV